eukprot:20132_1
MGSVCSEPKNQSTKIIPKHLYLQRASKALKYYEALFVESKDINDAQERFSDYCCESYPNWLDDYINIIRNHDGDDLDQIAQELREDYGFSAQCDVNKCGNFRRHYDERRSKSEESKEKYSGRDIFCCQYFDQLHLFLFHLFDIGMRSKMNDIQVVENKNDDDDFISCYDEIFAKKRDLIRSKRKMLGNDIGRYNDENNKYNICIEQSSYQSTNNNIANGTFLDEIYSVINKNHEIETHKLMRFCADEEFDTDAIEADIDVECAVESNISIHSNVHVIDIIRKYITIMKLAQTSLSTGLNLVYWDKAEDYWYEDKERLYVAPIHASIKEEVLFSGFVDAKFWKDNIMLK